MLFGSFEAYCERHHLLPAPAKLLLTVSGGIDSMVMMHLFHRKGIDCAVAHCNFRLRGDESDGDALFVREQALKLGFSFHEAHFDTTAYAAENQLSIQMAARELRYAWFNRLAKELGIGSIAVAHNKDDALETFFINLSRGTGLAGLKGIPPKVGNIIRPLLFASREAISRYSREQDIPYRDDSSNASDKYLRNYIRHHILPSLEKAVPTFRHALSQSMEHLEQAGRLYEYAIRNLSEQMVTHGRDQVTIDIGALIASPAPGALLFELLKPYHFPAVMTEEILQSATAASGKQFFSPTHRLVKDRHHFILTRNTRPEPVHHYIEADSTAISGPFEATIRYMEKEAGFVPDRSSGIALLDADKLAYPLLLRQWQQGDYFVPLGMKGLKKISDFFVDRKVPRTEKENTWILFSGNQVAWIVGHRIDDRFKITDRTTRICRIEINKASR